MLLRKIAIVITVLVAQSIPQTAASREVDIDKWVERDLVPYTRQQLLQQSRFRGETVMFVVLDGNAPEARSNVLALSIRDRLLRAAIDTPGVNVGWRQGAELAANDTAADCGRNDVHYYIGVELRPTLDGRYEASLRALDLEDGSLVAGFSRRWSGRLSTVQRQALRQGRDDTTFRGGRAVPYSAADKDLIARELARDLGCDLLRGSAGSYRLPDAADTDAAELPGAADLVIRNLVMRQAAELETAAVAANVTVQASLHHIDADLYEYWLTVAPVTADEDLKTVGASRYVRLPSAATMLAATPPAADTPDRPAATGASSATSASVALFGPLDISDDRLVSPMQSDAVVFVVAHQPGHGLVRIAADGCGARALPVIAERGQLLQQRVPLLTGGGPQTVSEVRDWRLAPERPTVYALAAADDRLARELARLVNRLPARCNAALRAGLDGADLALWLDEFRQLAASAPTRVGWRGIALDAEF